MQRFVLTQDTPKFLRFVYLFIFCFFNLQKHRVLMGRLDYRRLSLLGLFSIY